MGHIWEDAFSLSYYMGLLPDTYNCGLRMHRECRERFPRHRLHKKLLVSDPGMHHGTCVTHVPWCMSGSLTRGGGENVPGIPGACATRSFRYLIWGPLILIYLQDSIEDTPDFITPQKHSLLHSTAAFASSDNLKVIVWRRDIGRGLISYHQHSNDICDNIPQLAITIMIIYLSFESLYLMRSSKTKWSFGTNDIH